MIISIEQPPFLLTSHPLALGWLFLLGAAREIKRVAEECTMLKSCAYCGRVHDSRIKCAPKMEALSKFPKDSGASRIRNSSRWQKVRDHVRQRDNNVCQLCLRRYAGYIRPYEGEGLSVHHIIKIEDDASKAFDESNLITLCRIHHDMAEAGEIPKADLLKIIFEK